MRSLFHCIVSHRSKRCKVDASLSSSASELNIQSVVSPSKQATTTSLIGGLLENHDRSNDGLDSMPIIFDVRSISQDEFQANDPDQEDSDFDLVLHFEDSSDEEMDDAFFNKDEYFMNEVVVESTKESEKVPSDIECLVTFADITSATMCLNDKHQNSFSTDTIAIDVCNADSNGANYAESTIEMIDNQTAVSHSFEPKDSTPNCVVESKGQQRQTTRMDVVSNPNFFLYKTFLSSNYDGIDHFQHFSDEVILSIFKLLPREDLLRCLFVSKRFHRIGQHSTLWKCLDLSKRIIWPGWFGQVLRHNVTVLSLAQTKVSLWSAL